MIDVGVLVESQIDFAQHVIAARLSTFPARLAEMKIQPDIFRLCVVVTEHRFPSQK